MIANAAGNLYGTTANGGFGGPSTWEGIRASDCGTVFKLSPGTNGKWTHTVLHSFDFYKDEGCSPTAGVVFDGVGNLYGTTMGGGWYSVGTIYEIIP